MMKFVRTKAAAAVACVLSASGAAVVCGPVLAQDVRIEVTGTNIKRVDTETPSPVTIITSEDIQRSGATTVSEVLRNIPANNAGTLNESANASFAAGASIVSLRGLGGQATLVLLNGRRLTNYAFSNGGQITFVDLNSIPLNAIERIEVLKDGASAIYGSDAMAGVVNILTRKDYRGAEARASYGRSQEGDGDQTTVGVSGGWGDLARDRFNVFANYSYFRREPIYLRDRNYFVNSADLTSIGYRDFRSVNGFPGTLERTVAGSVVRVALPGCDPANLVTDATGTRCFFDPNKSIATVPKSERNAVFASAQFALTPSVTLFGEGSFLRNETHQISFPATPTTWLRATDLTLQSVTPLVLPVGHPQNPYTTPVTIRYNFGEDVGSRTSNITTDFSRALLGAKAALGTWDLESAFIYNKSETDNFRTGFLVADVLRQSIANGSFVFGDPRRNSSELLARLSPTLHRAGETELKAVDAKATTTNLYKLPYGSIGLALGAEYRKESLKDEPDPLYATGQIVGLGATGARGQRHVTAVYGELMVPAYKDLEVQLALRTDKYQNFERSTTPKVGVRWTPMSQLLLRGTYAEGFRAPSLPESADSVLTGFYNGIQDPARCPTTATAADCRGSIPVVIGPNKNLKPEESKSYTLGVVFEPVREFSVAVDYYDIRRTNEIASLDPDFLLANERLFPGLVFRGPPLASDPPGIPGPLQYLNTQYINVSATKTRGYDIDAVLRLPAGAYGALKFVAAGNYVESYKYRAAADQPYAEFNGTHNQPRFRGQASVTWDYGPWSTTATVRYIGEFDLRGTPYSPCSVETTFPSGCTIKPWAPIDLYAQYTGFKNLTIFGSIKNIQNLKPRLDLTYTENYNYYYHDVYGRYFTIGAQYTFR